METGCRHHLKVFFIRSSRGSITAVIDWQQENHPKGATSAHGLAGASKARHSTRWKQTSRIGTTSNIPHWPKMTLLIGLGFEAHRIMSYPRLLLTLALFHSKTSFVLNSLTFYFFSFIVKQLYVPISPTYLPKFSGFYYWPVYPLPMSMTLPG